MPSECLVGKQFGLFKVLVKSTADAGPRAAARYIVQCKCGKERFVRAYDLKAGKSRSCGCDGKGHKTFIKRVWTDEDMEKLRRLYPTMGARKLEPILGRSRLAIRATARLHGIRVLSRVAQPKDWSPEEVAIMHEHYPNKPCAEMLAMLPRRNKEAIKAKACDLGLKKKLEPKPKHTPRPRWWSDEEEAILKNHFRDGYELLQKLLPKRSKAAIKQKIIEMNLRHLTPDDPHGIQAMLSRVDRRAA